MRHAGLRQYRLRDNPEEERFAKAWEHSNRYGNTLAHLLDERDVQGGYPLDVSDRDMIVAATVVQWLGSTVGQGFLQDLGYVRRT